MSYPKVNLRLFRASDGERIARWVVDPAYEIFFRNILFLPSLEDCANFPAWSQQLVMMVEDEQGDTIGMVTGAQLNIKAKTIHSGILIEKECQGSGYGKAVHAAWFDYLFRQKGMRKIIVENVHTQFTDVYKSNGFEVEGLHKKASFVGGEYVDEIRMACFVENWKGKEAVLEGR